MDFSTIWLDQIITCNSCFFDKILRIQILTDLSKNIMIFFDTRFINNKRGYYHIDKSILIDHIIDRYVFIQFLFYLKDLSLNLHTNCFCFLTKHCINFFTGIQKIIEFKLLKFVQSKHISRLREIKNTTLINLLQIIIGISIPQFFFHLILKLI